MEAVAFGVTAYALFAAFFAWLICAIVAAFIAGSRRRSSFGWFFATFFILGPLGVGFALIAPRGDVEEHLLQLRSPAPTPAAQPRSQTVNATAVPKPAVSAKPKADAFEDADAAVEAAEQRAKAARERADELRRRVRGPQG
jgi:hypothetical protein